MAKIQISTIQKEANVEIVELNSSFVAKVIRAKMIADMFKSTVENDLPKIKNSSNKEEIGKPYFKQDVCVEMSSCNIECLYKFVFSFIDELSDAILND